MNLLEIIYEHLLEVSQEFRRTMIDFRVTYEKPQEAVILKSWTSRIEITHNCFIIIQPIRVFQRPILPRNLDPSDPNFFERLDTIISNFFNYT